MKQIKPIAWGVALVVLGIIFGGNAIGLFNIDIFFRGWWTLFIIIPSFVGLFSKGERYSDLFTLAVGVILLLASQEVFDWDVAWKVILATFIILIGISILIKTIFREKIQKNIEAEMKNLKKEGDVDTEIAIFSGTDRTYHDEDFKGAQVTAIFGAAELDLRQAIIKKDTIIKIFCLFGGVDIKVPENIQIKTKSGFIFGGVTDDRKSESDKEKYTIYIDAAGGFGGVSINDKVPKDKEKKK